MRPSDCRADFLAGRFDETFGGFGSVYYTPGESNTGIPNFSEGAIFSVPVSYGDDGYNSVNYVDYSTNGNAQFTQIIPDLDTVSAMAFGEYTFEGESQYHAVLRALVRAARRLPGFRRLPAVPDGTVSQPVQPLQPRRSGRRRLFGGLQQRTDGPGIRGTLCVLLRRHPVGLRASAAESWAPSTCNPSSRWPATARSPTSPSTSCAPSRASAATCPGSASARSTTGSSTPMPCSRRPTAHRRAPAYAATVWTLRLAGTRRPARLARTTPVRS